MMEEGGIQDLLERVRTKAAPGRAVHDVGKPFISMFGDIAFLAHPA